MEKINKDKKNNKDIKRISVIEELKDELKSEDRFRTIKKGLILSELLKSPRDK